MNNAFILYQELIIVELLLTLDYTDSCGIHMMKLVLCVGVESGQISPVNGTETNRDFCFKC